MPLVNRAPVNAAGQIMVTGTTPTPAWPVLGGMTYDPVTGELAVTSAVPNATDPWVGGLRFTNLGSLYIVTTIPSPVFYVGGLPVSTLGQLFMSANPPVGSVGGWPIAGDGGVAGIGSGIGPVPIFFAPLLSSLVPTIAGNPTATFTRATTAYATGVGPGSNAVDGELLILCNANEPRFQGARRVSAGVWSETYADGSAIPLAKLLGYVAENAATNLCLQSQTFDNAANWLTGNAVIAANDATVAAPDGTLTADKFTDDATNSFHRCYSSPSGLTNGASYTFSIYAKAGTLTWLQLILGATATDRWANFNLVTGVVGNKGAAATTSTITALPNGWYRCSLTVLADSTGVFAQIVSSNSNASAADPAYVGTGQTMFLWGAQVEASSDVSSYIATTTVAVVRNLDALTYPVASNISGATATVYIEAYPPVAAVGIYQVLFKWIADSKGPMYYDINAPKNLYSAFLGGLISTVNVRTIGAVNKNAVAWSGSFNSLCLNGGAVTAGAAFTPFTSSGNIAIGDNAAGSNFQGYLRNVKFYATKLTDAELIALTT